MAPNRRVNINEYIGKRFRTLQDFAATFFMSILKSDNLKFRHDRILEHSSKAHCALGEIRQDISNLKGGLTAISGSSVPLLEEVKQGQPVPRTLQESSFKDKIPTLPNHTQSGLSHERRGGTLGQGWGDEIELDLL